MKEKIKNKKIVYTIIGIIAVLLVAIAITYAYWLITKNQTGENIITAACLDISLTNEENDITLTNQFPLSDEDGTSLTPYTFTVTNNCNTSVDYHINLESIGTESEAIISSAIKAMLDENTPQVLSSYSEKDITIEGAYEARLLGSGTLSAKDTEGSSATHSLRLWIDADAPISEMNKTFRSKISVTIGQGIVNDPIKPGTLAYDILSNFGGASAITEIDASDVAERITATGNQFISTSSSYYYGTSYTYDAEEGKYILGGTLVQATLTECRSGTKTCGKYTLMNSDSTYSSTTLYEVIDFQTSGYYVTANIIKYTNEFGVSTTSSDAGLYKAQDDYGTSYYFRGDVEKNYVEFGTYVAGSTVNGVTYDVETPIYWRIVRINGDGSVRLIYDGTEKVANGVDHTATIHQTAYNASGYNAKYVGYTYDDGSGNQVDSTIKGVVDEWYTNNLEQDYGKYIADSIFCNDREIANTSGEENYYGAYDRLYTNKNPKLTCTNQSDRYTVEDTAKGNGLLTKPIGLITADEVAMAGGVFRQNNTTYYLYSSEYYWTSNPVNFHYMYGAFVWIVSNSGLETSYEALWGGGGARPVINLKLDVPFTFNSEETAGTIDDPYVIVTE